MNAPTSLDETIRRAQDLLWSALPPGVALAPETLVLEIKPGPYRPNEFAPWAPEEGEPASGAFVHWAAGARVGSKWRSQVA